MKSEVRSSVHLDDLRHSTSTIMLAKLLLLCLLAVTSALNAGVSARVPSRTAVTMSATGRRAAVAGLFAATLAQSASAKTIEEIAAESNKAAVADREAAAAAPVRAATPRPAAQRAVLPPAPPHLPHRFPVRRSRTRTRTSSCRSSPSAAAARCSRRSSSPRTSSASARRSRAAARTTATRSRRTSAAGERPSPPEPYSASLSVVLRDFMKRRTRVRADRTFLATLAPARKFS